MAHALSLLILGVTSTGFASALSVRDSKCSQLSVPANASLVQWPSDALSSRRIQAYEIAASWSAVKGAQSYTFCWQESTASRTGGLFHVYDRCVTQTGTKWNQGFVYYDNNGPVTAKVRANGAQPCAASAWVNVTDVTKLTAVAQVCTDDKVNSEYESESLAPFLADADSKYPVHISKIERLVKATDGAASYNVSIDWSISPAFLNSTAGKSSLSKLTFEVCVGPEEDFNNAAAGALSNYTCQYVQPMGKTSGTVVVPLDISAPNAAYITGQVRLVGYCTADPVPLEKVTIATYYKIKVLNPISSGANGVDDVETGLALNPEGFHMVTTSRTTPDQTIDVNYFVSVLVGMLDTWQLPVRTTPEGLVIHDTFITRFDGVVTLTSSNAGEDSSVAMSLYTGEGATATGLVFESYQGEQAVKPEMHFKFARGKQTTIESQSQKKCVAQNDSPDEYDPPFKLVPCSKGDKKQAFLFNEYAPGWNEVGATWIYERDNESPDLSKWKRVL